MLIIDKKVKSLLDELYFKYNNFEYYKNDPIIFPHKYSDERDIEVAGLIASSFAYGKLGSFMVVLDKIFKILGKSPTAFLENFNLKRDKVLFTGIKYRYNSNEDVLMLIYSLSECIKRWGSIKKLFLEGFNRFHNIKDGLSFFVRELETFIQGEKFTNPYEIKMLPNPERGSACKRLNLFLRWMVRDRDIDFGIWKEVGKENLIIPLDTHVGKISRCLGLLKKNSNDWLAASELTNSLKKFDPYDPVKYDFALCHIGIDGICNRNRCNNCKIRYQIFEKS